MFKKYESVIMYNEIINVTNSTTNVTNTLPINSDEEKVRYKILYNRLIVDIIKIRLKKKCFEVLTI